ncbi:hypothetical protein PsorP6_009466 [Peronosclerospora sorghi]|uniref:Uncharacterized protein n=1 Tax=Peronosclerospora sorghi TaxID=230839 RepID=A0ACC0W187_9STRA|nr:hypothetical protein PsorP6_009466 [Peronosclerospora sorghi]
MTFPNRSEYVPGQHRQAPKSIMPSKDTPVMPKTLPPRALGGKKAERKSDGMLQEAQLMLAALSPVHGGEKSGLQKDVCDYSPQVLGPLLWLGSVQSIPTKEESLTLVENCRKCLFEDETYQENESYRKLLTLANNPAIEDSDGAINPFAAIIEQILPRHQEFDSTSDGFSSSDTNRFQFMEAASLQTIAHAARKVVEDPTVRARYDHAAHMLHDWGERRRMQQQQLRQTQRGLVSIKKDGSFLPSLPLSLAGISPYAMELAARNSLPKKRSSLSKLSKKLMLDWFEHNLHHPYPTEEEKDWLAQRGGITLEQVNNWFINTRGRKWKPMLNRLMAEKRAGDCKLYDQMVEKIEEPYRKF